MAIRVILSDDPAWVLSASRSFLAAEPVLHNLILTIMLTRVTYPEPGRYWVATDDSHVIGLVFQSPLDMTANLSVLGSPAIAAIVDAIADAGLALPGVNGEAATAARFAGQWTERCKSAAVPCQGLRIYEVSDVKDGRAVSGLSGTQLPKTVTSLWLGRVASTTRSPARQAIPSACRPLAGRGPSVDLGCRWACIHGRQPRSCGRRRPFSRCVYAARSARPRLR